MSRHVLVAIDHSDVSDRAFEYTISEYPEAKITAIHVIESATPFLAIGFAVDGFDEIPKREREQAETLIEEARQLAAEQGVEIHAEIKAGKPAEKIVACAEEKGVDHLVIGSHGRTKANRILIGSVAEGVARRAPVPLTIIR